MDGVNSFNGRGRDELMVRWIKPEMERLAEEVQRLKHELTEAEAEIARHHADFQKIRDVIDGYNGTSYVVHAIRNIVG